MPTGTLKTQNIIIDGVSLKTKNIIIDGVSLDRVKQAERLIEATVDPSETIMKRIIQNRRVNLMKNGDSKRQGGSEHTISSTNVNELKEFVSHNDDTYSSSHKWYGPLADENHVYYLTLVSYGYGSILIKRDRFTGKKIMERNFHSTKLYEMVLDDSKLGLYTRASTMEKSPTYRSMVMDKDYIYLNGGVAGAPEIVKVRKCDFTIVWRVNYVASYYNKFEYPDHVYTQDYHPFAPIVPFNPLLVPDSPDIVHTDKPEEYPWPYFNSFANQGNSLTFYQKAHFAYQGTAGLTIGNGKLYCQYKSLIYGNILSNDDVNAFDPLVKGVDEGGYGGGIICIDCETGEPHFKVSSNPKFLIGSHNVPELGNVVPSGALDTLPLESFAENDNKLEINYKMSDSESFTDGSEQIGKTATGKFLPPKYYSLNPTDEFDSNIKYLNDNVSIRTPVIYDLSDGIKIDISQPLSVSNGVNLIDKKIIYSDLIFNNNTNISHIYSKYLYDKAIQVFFGVQPCCSVHFGDIIGGFSSSEFRIATPTQLSEFRLMVQIPVKPGERFLIDGISGAWFEENKNNSDYEALFTENNCHGFGVTYQKDTDGNYVYSDDHLLQIESGVLVESIMGFTLCFDDLPGFNEFRGKQYELPASYDTSQLNTDIWNIKEVDTKYYVTIGPEESTTSGLEWNISEGDYLGTMFYNMDYHFEINTKVSDMSGILLVGNQSLAVKNKYDELLEFDLDDSNNITMQNNGSFNFDDPNKMYITKNGEIQVRGKDLTYVRKEFDKNIHANKYKLNISEAGQLNFFSSNPWGDGMVYDEDKNIFYFGTGNASHIPVYEEDKIHKNNPSFKENMDLEKDIAGILYTKVENNEDTSNFIFELKTKIEKYRDKDTNVEYRSSADDIITELEKDTISFDDLIPKCYQFTRLCSERRFVVMQTLSPRFKRCLQSSVTAINGSTGEILWTYKPEYDAFHHGYLNSNRFWDLKKGPNGDFGAGLHLFDNVLIAPSKNGTVYMFDISKDDTNNVEVIPKMGNTYNNWLSNPMDIFDENKKNKHKKTSYQNNGLDVVMNPPLTKTRIGHSGGHSLWLGGTVFNSTCNKDYFYSRVVNTYIGNIWWSNLNLDAHNTVSSHKIVSPQQYISCTCINPNLPEFGKVIWETPCDDVNVDLQGYTCVVANDVVYTVDQSCNMVMYNANSGEKIHTMSLNEDVNNDNIIASFSRAPPLILDGVIYFTNATRGTGENRTYKTFKMFTLYGT